MEEKIVKHLTAIISIGTNDKCNIGQKPVCLNHAKPDEFTLLRNLWWKVFGFTMNNWF